MKGFSGFKESPVKQKKEKYNWTVVDARPKEVIDKEKEEIKKEEEKKKKDQKKIEQQIEGTYVETSEDIENRKKRWVENRPKKKK